MPSERRAYECPKCLKEGGVANRRFQRPGEPEPRCRTHGKMVRQRNQKYFGKPT